MRVDPSSICGFSSLSGVRSYHKGFHRLCSNERNKGALAYRTSLTLVIPLFIGQSLRGTIRHEYALSSAPLPIIYGCNAGQSLSNASTFDYRIAMADPLETFDDVRDVITLVD
jgi:hypothetical protein